MRQNSALQREAASLRAQFADQGVKLEEANGIMTTLLDPVADAATKDQPAVHDMLQTVRAAAAKN